MLTEMGRFLGITVIRLPPIGTWTDTLKNHSKCMWRREPDRRSNINLLSPPSHFFRHIYNWIIVAWDVKRKKEIWLGPMTKALIPKKCQTGKWQYKNATNKKFDYTAIADQLRNHYSLSGTLLLVQQIRNICSFAFYIYIPAWILFNTARRNMERDLYFDVYTILNRI